MIKWMAFVLFVLSLPIISHSATLIDKNMIQQKLAEGIRESPYITLPDGSTWKYVGLPSVRVNGFHITIDFNVEPTKTM